MKFLHTADLHIGKSVNEFSMLEDQRHVLCQMLRIAKEEKADAFLIAGDVYDRAVPSVEAVRLLDFFLTELARADIPVLIAAGNHDSAQRLSFAREILVKSRIYIAGGCENGIKKADICGVEFWLLPFLRPAFVGCANSDEAVRGLLSDSGFPAEAAAVRKHRVLVTHYFVTAGKREPELSDSETSLHVGGIDNVDVSAFDGFSYTALGHIHKAQPAGSDTVWYSGAPLAYSFSENSADKSVNLVELTDGQERALIRRIFLKPLHEMRRAAGLLSELLSEGERMRKEENPAREDYIQAYLTDEGELFDPMNTLRSVYPNVMQIVSAKRGKNAAEDFKPLSAGLVRPGVSELYSSFYELVKDEEMDENRRRIVSETEREIG